MAFLYVNAKGQPHRKHSYSAGLDYSQSPYKYYLKRVVGWKPKDDRASFKFGRALEEAIQSHHDNQGKGALEEFIRLWSLCKDQKDLKFTKTEKDWETLNRMGQDMIKLYVVRQPSLPIPLGGGSVFQREYSKMVFGDDPTYGEIEFSGKLDVIAYVEPAHPLLPKVEWKSEDGPLRPAIIDVKTAAQDFGESQGLAAFDKQLKVYSWLSGIRDVGLLWFVKKSLGYKKNSRVTLLVNKGVFEAGAEMYVAQTRDEGAYLVPSQMALEDLASAQGRKADGSLDTKKDAVARKTAWIQEYALDVDEEDFTRQRLQFNSGRVSDAGAADAGNIAGRQIVAIVNSWKNNSWPNEFGIRYPTDDRNDPYFRAFVLNDEAFKSENFKLANPEEMDELFDDEPEQEEEGE